MLKYITHPFLLLLTLVLIQQSVAQFVPFANMQRNTKCYGTPWGTVQNGYLNTAYSSATPAGLCINYDEVRTCSNGVFSGSYINASCANGCSAQTVNWTISSSSCSASASALVHGGSTTVTDSANPTTGTRNISCSNGTLSDSGGSCAESCGGALVGGYCWYFGGDGQSCDTVCGSHGGYNSATLSYAGSGGSNENCLNVLNALSAGSGSVSALTCFSPPGAGCGNASGLRFRCTNSTVSSDSYADVFRACACND